MKKNKAPILKRMKSFGLSAFIAFVIAIIGVFTGASFIYGFGFFMIAIVSLLVMVAVIEYVVH